MVLHKAEAPVQGETGLVLGVDDPKGTVETLLLQAIQQGRVQQRAYALPLGTVGMQINGQLAVVCR